MADESPLLSGLSFDVFRKAECWLMLHQLARAQFLRPPTRCFEEKPNEHQDTQNLIAGIDPGIKEILVSDRRAFFRQAALTKPVQTRDH